MNTRRIPEYGIKEVWPVTGPARSYDTSRAKNTLLTYPEPNSKKLPLRQIWH
jgi:hypothetical protein